MSEKQRYWWIEDLLDKDSKAMGVYLALLYLRIERDYAEYSRKPSVVEVLSGWEKFYSTYFAGRGTEAREAVEAGRVFVDRLFEHEDVLKSSLRNVILDEIEGEFFDRFVKAFSKYLRLSAIPDDLREMVCNLLLDIRSQIYDRTYVTPLTMSGTTKVYGESVKGEIGKYYAIDKETVDKLFRSIEASGIGSIKYYGSYIFPSVCLSDDIIRSIRKPEEKKLIELIPSPPKPEEFKVKPGREILEKIAASVFEELGFSCTLNARIERRDGRQEEVDVWAERQVGNMRFSAYVSCKNWNSSVDRRIIDEESGRVNQLRKLPQLKIIVAKELTEPARSAAEADGFMVIELGEKADAENAIGAYELVYRTLNELFTAIAPRRLRELATKISTVAEDLKRISDELTALSPKRLSDFM